MQIHIAESLRNGVAKQESTNRAAIIVNQAIRIEFRVCETARSSVC